MSETERAVHEVGWISLGLGSGILTLLVMIFIKLGEIAELLAK